MFNEQQWLREEAEREISYSNSLRRDLIGGLFDAIAIILVGALVIATLFYFTGAS